MDDKNIHLKDYLRVINKRKNTVITFFVITFAVVVIATVTVDPVYKASTKVLIERNTSNALTGNSSYVAYDPQFLETQEQIIKSSSVARKVISSFNETELYKNLFPEQKKTLSFFDKTIALIRSTYHSFKKSIGIESLLSQQNQDLSNNEPLEPISKLEAMVKTIQKNINVEPLQNSRVIEITYTSRNPSLSMAIVNNLSQAYINELLDQRLELSGYSIKWMTKKAESESKKLEASEKALHDYQRKYNIVTIEDRITVIPERLSELSRSLTKAETESKELGSLYQQIRQTEQDKLETIPAIVANVSIDSIKKQIIISEQKIAELSKKYGPKHPVMATALGDLTSLKKKKDQEIQNAVQTIRNQFMLAKSNEENLRKLLRETQSEAANLNEKYIQLNILKRDVETNRYLYDALIKTMKEKGITEESQSINVWVIEKAVIPRKPYSPNPVKNTLLAVILGVLGGLGLALFFEYLDNTVKSPEDIEERFDTPVIGTIGIANTKKQSILETVQTDSNSLLSENFKSLRTSILLSAAGKPPDSLFVTSMSPAEGKSSVSACLAITMGKMGKKTLFIDADMRRPIQFKQFGLDNTAGLSTYLAGTSQLDVIHSSVTDNLDVLTSGPIPPNPSELLSSARMTQLISELKPRYDMIIIDTPPTISVSDSLIIGRLVEGAVIVALAGSTTYDLLKKGLKFFQETSTPITGIVVNKFDAKKSGYYYGYGDYYYSSTS